MLCAATWTKRRAPWRGVALSVCGPARVHADVAAVHCVRGSAGGRFVHPQAVHTAFLQTIEDNQGDDGDVPYVIPASNPHNGSCNDIAWTSAYPQITSMLHTYYGDARVVARHWPSLVRYQENLIGHAAADPHKLAECDGFKDWLCGNAQSCCTNLPAGSSCPVGPEMGSFNYVLGLRAMASMAAVLGKTNLTKRYGGLARAAAASFHTAFWDTKLRAYGGDLGATQSLTTPALAINSAPAALQGTVAATLDDDLRTTTGYRPFVGAVTSKILLNVLSDNGLHETAIRTATSTAEPSWGFWWTQNSSTCWESWPLGHGTRNHIFLCGGAGEWMWKHLVGITPTAPRFQEVAVAPKVHPVQGPASASGTYTSAAGPITSTWNVSKGGAAVALAVSLPVGVRQATVLVPKPFTLAPSPPEVVCAAAREKAALTLSCGAASKIVSIDFAAFGTPSHGGSCSAWASNTTCGADEARVVALVEKRCLRQQSCAITVNASDFGPDPCHNVVKTLAVVGKCAGGQAAVQDTRAVVKEGGVVVWDGTAMVGNHPGHVKERCNKKRCGCGCVVFLISLAHLHAD